VDNSIASAYISAEKERIPYNEMAAGSESGETESE
jgi:hypothetical protein